MQQDITTLATALASRSRLSFQKEDRARRKAMTSKQRDKLRIETLKRARKAKHVRGHK